VARTSATGVAIRSHHAAAERFRLLAPFRRRSHTNTAGTACRAAGLSEPPVASTVSKRASTIEIRAGAIERCDDGVERAPDQFDGMRPSFAATYHGPIASGRIRRDMFFPSSREPLRFRSVLDKTSLPPACRASGAERRVGPGLDVGASGARGRLSARQAAPDLFHAALLSRREVSLGRPNAQIDPRFLLAKIWPEYSSQPSALGRHPAGMAAIRCIRGERPFGELHLRSRRESRCRGAVDRAVHSAAPGEARIKAACFPQATAASRLESSPSIPRTSR